jgi:hypothetical protein
MSSLLASSRFSAISWSYQATISIHLQIAHASKQLEKTNLSPAFQYVAGHYQKVQSQETKDLHKLPVTF